MRVTLRNKEIEAIIINQSPEINISIVAKS